MNVFAKSFNEGYVLDSLNNTSPSLRTGQHDAEEKNPINWGAFGFVLESVSIFKHGKYQGMSGEADEGRRMPSGGKTSFIVFALKVFSTGLHSEFF